MPTFYIKCFRMRRQEGALDLFLDIDFFLKIMYDIISTLMKRVKFKMAKNKFYAVRVGKETGIFDTWEKCQAATRGYSGAEFSSFITYEEAEAYLRNEDYYDAIIKRDLESGYVVAFTDGSYNEGLSEYSYGLCVFDHQGNEFDFFSKGNNSQFVEFRNLAGEVFGVLTALDWAVSNGYDKIKIYHDLIHIQKWANGEYKADSPIATFYTKKLRERYDECISYEFVHVKGHSKNKYNEKADKLAANAFVGEKVLIKGNNSFVVSYMKPEDLDVILELISEENSLLQKEEKTIQGGKQYKLRLNKDYVIIKHYISNKLLVQGKPNLLYQVLLTYVSEIIGEDKVIPLVKEAYRLKIDKSIIDNNYENLCSNVPCSYNANVRCLLRQAIVNLNGYFEAEDYGQYTFPALRALEGHIKILFAAEGILVGKQFDQFKDTSDGYVLKKKFTFSPEKRAALEDCYNFLAKQRHTIFHFGDVIGMTDNTRILTSKNEANEIIRSTLQLINRTVI